MNARIEMPHLCLDELKDLVLLHARAQGLEPALVQRVLDGIESAGSLLPASWPEQWMHFAAEAEAQGNHDLAVKLYNLGRFPFVDSDARQLSHQHCLMSFRKWCEKHKAPITPLRLVCDGFQFTTYVRRSFKPDAPLLLVFGGIVSIKEQWGLFLTLADKLQVDVAVTELPGVGENTLPLTASSHKMVGAVLDALNVTPKSGCHIVAMSFGGTLALRHALSDSRIRGVTTVGAPVSRFYRDAQWWAQIPSTTRVTMAKIFGCSEAEAFRQASELQLTDAELASLRIPVYYVQSLRDEIIQCKEVDDLKNIPGKLHLLSIDDVHGAPGHLGLVRLFVASSIFNTLFPGSLRAPLLRAATALGCRIANARFQTFSKPIETEQDGAHYSHSN